LNIEFRGLAVLRLKLLKDLQHTKGIVPIKDFRQLFRCMINNATEEFECKFIETIKHDKDHISYHKLCDIIKKFQYNLHYVK